MIVKLLTEHHLEFLSLKGCCTGSSESTLVKLLEITCHGSYSNVCGKCSEGCFVLSYPIASQTDAKPDAYKKRHIQLLLCKIFKPEYLCKLPARFAKRDAGMATNVNICTHH